MGKIVKNVTVAMYEYKILGTNIWVKLKTIV